MEAFFTYFSQLAVLAILAIVTALSFMYLVVSGFMMLLDWDEATTGSDKAFQVVAFIISGIVFKGVLQLLNIFGSQFT